VNEQDPRASTDSRPEISLVLPCYDEEAVIGKTILGLFAAFENAGRRLEIVAVDNGSCDRTGEILRELARRRTGLVLARVEVNQGYGNGLLVGLPLATAPWIGILCADGQVAAEDVAALFLRAERSEEPRIFKVRRRFRRDGLRRKILSVAYNLTMIVLFPGLGSIDVNGNPKLLPRACLERMRLVSKDWFLDAEILIRARRLRVPVVEVDVVGYARAGGASNVSAGTCWEFARNLLRYRWGAGRVDPRAEPEPPPEVPRELPGQPPRGSAVRGR
jgi:glycosyltransferase involved in cell wall biosynthesis